TMRSSRRRSRRLRMFLSIRLSSGENPVSVGAAPSSRILRSDRIEVGLQPNSARIKRLNHDSRGPRESPLERRASPGKWRWPLGPAPSQPSLASGGWEDERGGSSESAMASKSEVCIARRIGIGDADPSQDVAFQAFHLFGFFIR